MDRPSNAASTKEEREKVRSEADGDFIMCEVEEKQAARLEGRGPKRRAVIRVESEETWGYVRKKL